MRHSERPSPALTAATFLSDRPISHSYFQRQETKEIGIPVVLKSAILVQGVDKSKRYVDKAKILSRNESALVSEATLSPEYILEHEKMLRSTGVSADTAKPYRTLGTVVMDTTELLVKTLSIDYDLDRHNLRAREAERLLDRSASQMDVSQKAASEKDAATAAAANSTKNTVEGFTAEKRASNGFSDIKRAVDRSSARITSVRNGLSFDNAVHRRSQSRRPSVQSRRGGGGSSLKRHALEDAVRFAFTADDGTDFQPSVDGTASEGEPPAAAARASFNSLTTPKPSETASSQLASIADIRFPSAAAAGEPNKPTLVRFELDIERVLDSALEAATNAAPAMPSYQRARRPSMAVTAAQQQQIIAAAAAKASENETAAIVERLRKLHRKFYDRRDTAAMNVRADLQKHEADCIKLNRRKQEALGKLLSQPNTDMLKGAEFMNVVREEAELLRRRAREKVYDSLLEHMVERGVIAASHPRQLKHAGGMRADAGLPSILQTEQRHIDELVTGTLRTLRGFYDSDEPMTKAQFVELCKSNPPHPCTAKIFRFLKDNVVSLSEREFVEITSRYAVEEKSDQATHKDVNNIMGNAASARRNRPFIL